MERGGFDLPGLQALAYLVRAGRVLAYWHPGDGPWAKRVALHYVVRTVASDWQVYNAATVRDVLRMLFLRCN